MRMLGTVILIIVGCATAWGADWLADGGNSKRTAWQQDETILTKANISEMKLLWKMKLDNEPRQMHSLFPGERFARAR